jgi:hypothetical protein
LRQILELENELVNRAAFEMPPVKLGEKGLEIFFFQKQEEVGLLKVNSSTEILSPSFTGGISDVALWGS